MNSSARLCGWIFAWRSTNSCKRVTSEGRKGSFAGVLERISVGKDEVS